jgi:hypothetical protein
LIEPLSGEGIYYGLKSVYLALPVIIRFLEGKSRDLAEYDASMEREIFSELKIARSVEHLNSITPWIFFTLLSRNTRFWRAFCGMLRSERTNAGIKKSVPWPLRWLFRFYSPGKACSIIVDSLTNNKRQLNCSQCSTMIKIILATITGSAQRSESAFDAEPDFEVVGEAANGLETVRLVEKKRPDVRSLDLMMAGINAWKLLAGSIKRICPPASWSSPCTAMRLMFWRPCAPGPGLTYLKSLRLRS